MHILKQPSVQLVIGALAIIFQKWGKSKRTPHYSPLRENHHSYVCMCLSMYLVIHHPRAYHVSIFTCTIIMQVCKDCQCSLHVLYYSECSSLAVNYNDRGSNIHTCIGIKLYYDIIMIVKDWVCWLNPAFRQLWQYYATSFQFSHSLLWSSQT